MNEAIYQANGSLRTGVVMSVFLFVLSPLTGGITFFIGFLVPILFYTRKFILYEDRLVCKGFLNSNLVYKAKVVNVSAKSDYLWSKMIEFETEYQKIIIGGMTKECANIISKHFAKVAAPTHSPTEQSKSNPIYDQNVFEGDMNIDNPLYHLFLTRRFSIEKNSTLDKYVIGNAVYDTLKDSLLEADEKYRQWMMERDNAHQKNLETLSRVESNRLRDEQISKEQMVTDPSLERILRNNYSLVKCEFNKGQKTWTLQSKTTGQQFDLNGQQELEKFATSFPLGNEVPSVTTTDTSIKIPETFQPNSDRKWPR